MAWSIITRYLLAIQHWPAATASIRLQAAQTLDSVLTAASTVVEGGEKQLQPEIQNRIFDCLSTQARPSIESAETLSTSTDVEIRKLALETLFNILEHSGHALECGWSPIFDILRHISAPRQLATTASSSNLESQAASNSVPPSPAVNSFSNSSNARHAILVRIAFPSLQLICTDFLSALSVHELEECVNALSEYGSQGEDVNIAMTASGLLWQISDHIQIRGRQQEGSDRMSAEFARLWMILLDRLQHLSKDNRQEVRDGAMQILFRGLEVYGESLSIEEWNSCLWDVLLPLFDCHQPYQGNRLASVAEEEVSDSTGIFPSQESARDQWDASSILFMNSLATLWRSFLASKLVHTERFSEIYPSFTQYLERIIVHAKTRFVP